ncbi:MAG: hypothetical protein KGO53_08640 [Alphaproteobacteria bacterium]|nr:hypothetical protein [Alphaproteobacteria bacterium]
MIDENAEERGRLLPLLSGLGLDCDARARAEEGIHFCHEHQPDVIIMKATDRPATKEFLRLVRYHADGRRGPVVLLYADAPDLQNVGASILEGAAEFMMKPFDRALVLFKLEQAGVLTH